MTLSRPDWRSVAAAAGAVALGGLIVFVPGVIALVVPAILAVLGLIALTRWLGHPGEPPGTHERVLRWTIGGFVARLVLALIITNTPAAVYYLGGDAATYHTYAKWILDFGMQSIPTGLQTGKEGFYYTLVGLYRVFGAHNVSGLALNAALGAALAPIMTDITRRLFGSRAAHYVPPLVVLLPTMFLFTSQLLKEAPILFLFAVATDAAVRLSQRMTLSGMVVFTASIALSLTFRGPVALVAGAGLVAGVAFGRREVLSGLTTGLSALAGLAVLVLVVGLGYSGVRSTLQSSNLQQSNVVRSGLADQSGSGFGSDVDTSTTRKALGYLPIALARFTVGPFPWEIRGVRQLPALVDVLVLWWLLPSAWRGGREAFRRVGRSMSVLVLPAVAMSIVLSISVGNFGILVRERMQVLLLVVPVFALGLSLRPGRPADARVRERQPELALAG